MLKSLALACVFTCGGFAALAQTPTAPATPSAPATPKAAPDMVAGIPVNYDESEGGDVHACLIR